MHIHINQISKRYGHVVALDQINLSIPTGMFGILGPNGAGKTSLLKLMMGLSMPTSGNILIGSIDTRQVHKIRPMVSYLPQDFAMYPNMSVEDCMDYMGLLCGIKDKDCRRQVSEDLLNKVNLFEHKKKPFKKLSGGMKRRLGIAVSLIKNPEVLIVDEPTAGLDPEERVRLRDLLKDFSKNRIVILSTHIIEDITHTCQNIAILNQGHVLYAGDTKGLITQYQHRSESPESDMPTLEEAYLALMADARSHSQGKRHEATA